MSALDARPSGLTTSLLGVASACPGCADPWGPVPAVAVFAVPGSLRRCANCGTRALADSAEALENCEACGIPVPRHGDEALPQRCSECSQTLADEPTGSALAVAIGAEILHALTATDPPVGSPAVNAYLDRIARELGRHCPGAPAAPRIVIVRDDAIRTLALPPDTILISVGLLQALEDEAELAFVVGHELAHLASEDGERLLVRLGFRTLARGAEAAGAKAWEQAGADLTCLGYGNTRERQADATATSAVVEAGYDADAIRRWLNRIERRVESGDDRVANLFFAHPPPRDRLRETERILAALPRRPALPKVNREPFRRAAGPQALANLTLSTIAGPASPHGSSRVRQRVWRGLFWTATLLAALAAAVWFF